MFTGFASSCRCETRGLEGCSGELGGGVRGVVPPLGNPPPPGGCSGETGEEFGAGRPSVGRRPPPPGAGGCPPRQGRPWARCTDAGGTPRGCKVQQEITPPEEGGSRGAGSPFPARLLPTPRLGPWQPPAPSTSIRAPAPPGQCPDHSRIMADLSRRLAALMLLGAALCGEWTWDCLLVGQHPGGSLWKSRIFQNLDLNLRLAPQREEGAAPSGQRRAGGVGPASPASLKLEA